MYLPLQDNAAVVGENDASLITMDELCLVVGINDSSVHFKNNYSCISGKLAPNGFHIGWRRDEKQTERQFHWTACIDNPRKSMLYVTYFSWRRIVVSPFWTGNLAAVSTMRTRGFYTTKSSLSKLTYTFFFHISLSIFSIMGPESKKLHWNWVAPLSQYTLDVYLIVLSFCMVKSTEILPTP